MFVLIGHHSVQKCLLFRHAGAVLIPVCNVKLVSPGGQHSVDLRRTFLQQCLGGGHFYTFGGQCLGAGHFHTSASQPSDRLKKMLAKKKKKKWYEAPRSVLTGQSGFLKPARKSSMEESLRVRTLNTILYKSISELLSSHELNPQITTYNVEITKVSLLADYSVCRIYWKTSLSSDRDCQVQQILDKCAPRIRYLLMSHQILGSVPPLVFVQDKQYAALKEVEDLLKIADYGPSDDPETPVQNRKDAETKEHTSEKKRVLLGIDRDALYKQIEDYKQQSRDSSSQLGGSASLTQEQLDMLAEIRKQKLIEKKKRKAKKVKDDDITPKEFLLMRRLQKEQYDAERDAEDSQDRER